MVTVTRVCTLHHLVVTCSWVPWVESTPCHIMACHHRWDMPQSFILILSPIPIPILTVIRVWHCRRIHLRHLAMVLTLLILILTPMNTIHPPFLHIHQEQAHVEARIPLSPLPCILLTTPILPITHRHRSMNLRRRRMICKMKWMLQTGSILGNGRMDELGYFCLEFLAKKFSK